MKTVKKTVIVACKLPNGLDIGGVVINGPKPIPSGTPIAARPKRPGGYEITQGVDAELWERWLRNNVDSDLLKNNLIFADADQGVVLNWARKHGDTRSGFEQTVPNNG